VARQRSKKMNGQVIDLCFRYIAISNEAVAIKAFSLTELQNLSKLYHDIRNELKLVIEER